MKPQSLTNVEESLNDIILDLGAVTDLSASRAVEGIHHLEVRVFGLLREEQATDLEVPRMALLNVQLTAAARGRVPWRVVVIGAILWILGSLGHALRGRRHYW